MQTVNSYCLNSGKLTEVLPVNEGEHFGELVDVADNDVAFEWERVEIFVDTQFLRAIFSCFESDQGHVHDGVVGVSWFGVDDDKDDHYFVFFAFTNHSFNAFVVFANTVRDDNL